MKRKAAALARGPGELATSDHMNVQMVNALAAFDSVVDDSSESFQQTFLLRHLHNNADEDRDRLEV